MMNAWAFGSGGERDRHLGLVLPRMRPIPHHTHHKSKPVVDHTDSHSNHQYHHHHHGSTNDSGTKPTSSLEGIILPLFLAERIPCRQVAAMPTRLSYSYQFLLRFTLEFHHHHHHHTLTFCLDCMFSQPLVYISIPTSGPTCVLLCSIYIVVAAYIAASCSVLPILIYIL